MHAKINDKRNPQKAFLMFERIPQKPYLDIPKELENLEFCTIVHMTALPQTGVACGYFPTFNGKSIQDLHLQGKKIEPKDIQAQTEQFLGFIENGKQLEDLEITNMAHQMGLENLNLLRYDQNNKSVDLTVPLSDEDFETVATKPIKTINGVIQQIKNSPNGVFHFACHLYEPPAPPLFGLDIFKTGRGIDHWVLISLIKQVGQKPQMIYLDSINKPLSNNQLAHTFIISLYNKLFR